MITTGTFTTRPRGPIVGRRRRICRTRRTTHRDLRRTRGKSPRCRVPNPPTPQSRPSVRRSYQHPPRLADLPIHAARAGRAPIVDRELVTAAMAPPAWLHGLDGPAGVDSARPLAHISSFGWRSPPGGRWE